MAEDGTSDDTSRKFSGHLSLPRGSLVSAMLKQNGTVVPDSRSVEIVLTAEMRRRRASRSSSVGARSLRSVLRWLHLDWLLLSVVLVIVWGLLTLPIIFFHSEIVSLGIV